MGTIRTVLRPVHPIQNIEARAPGGLGLGPFFMKKISQFNFGKTNRNQTNIVIFPEFPPPLTPLPGRPWAWVRFFYLWAIVFSIADLPQINCLFYVATRKVRYDRMTPMGLRYPLAKALVVIAAVRAIRTKHGVTNRQI